MVGVEQQQRVFEEVVVLQEVQHVLGADEDSVWGCPHRISLFVEDLDGVNLLGPWFQHVIFDAFVDLLLVLAGALLKGHAQFLLLLQLLGPEVGIQLKFVFVQEYVYLGVGGDVEGRLC